MYNPRYPSSLLKHRNSILHDLSVYSQYISFKEFVQCYYPYTSDECPGVNIHVSFHDPLLLDDNVEALNRILDEGVNINCLNYKGNTPLVHAIINNGKLKRLYRCDLPNYVFERPDRNLTLIKFLLNNGADVNIKNNNAHTALHIACEDGNLTIVRLLIVTGADVNSLTHKRNTPLHNATCRGHVHIVKELLECGALTNIRNVNGHTVANLATNEQIAEALQPRVKNAY